MSKIRWTRVTESGLGDRLTDLHWLAAFARVQNCKLYTIWEKFDLKHIDAPHRREDIKLENVLAHIRLPSEIVIDKDTQCDRTFHHFIGAAAPYYDLWRTFAADICSWDVFEQALIETAKGFGFCAEINAVLATLPEKFCALHIRRGDKVRDEPSDGCFIHMDGLSELNELTFKAIDWARRSWDAFFVCGDEDEKLEPFIQRIREMGGRIVTIPKLEKWRMTYYDMAVMTRSEFNITSQKKSTFSSFPALIGKGRYRTVYDLQLDNCI